MCLPKRPFYLQNDINRSGVLKINLPSEGVSAPAIATSLTCNGNISDDQTKANKIPKDISANAHRETHVSQRLGLLQPTHLEDPASRCSSILVSLPSKVANGATINTHVHSIREKRSNGTELYQIEVVAPHGPSFILTCKNNFHRDYVFRGLSDRNMNRGSQTAVELSMERAENNDASANAQWYLPIEFDDSISAIFETLRNSFRNTGTIPGKDLIEDLSETTIKRRVLVIHARSDPWLKKYAMTSKGYTKRLLHAELVGSNEECCICQEVIQGHQSLLTGHTSNQAGELTKNVTPSPRGPSPPPQVPNWEGKTLPTSPDMKTALDTSNLPDRPAAQSAEEGDAFVPWQVPAAHSSSLAEVTISQFVADFAELNGRERACAATGLDIVSAFNGHIDSNFPGSSYEEKVSALRRKYYGVLSTSFRPNFPALENNRAFMLGKANLCNLPSGTTVPLMPEPVGEGSNVKYQTTRDQNLRRRKYQAKQKADALDPATPGILMILGQIKNAVEPRGFEEVDGAYEEPESYRRIQEKSKAEVEEAHSGSAKGELGRKRRSRTKRKVCQFILLWVICSAARC